MHPMNILEVEIVGLERKAETMNQSLTDREMLSHLKVTLPSGEQRSWQIVEEARQEEDGWPECLQN